MLISSKESPLDKGGMGKGVKIDRPEENHPSGGKGAVRVQVWAFEYTPREKVGGVLKPVSFWEDNLEWVDCLCQK